MGLSGLEPPTSRLSGVRSNQLSYRPNMIEVMERVKGIEPSSSAWKAEVLPLNYTRIWYKDILYIPFLLYNEIKCFAGREDRIRTCDPMVPNHVLYQAELLPVNGAPERSRTPNLLIRSQTLYPIELRALIKATKEE